VGSNPTPRTRIRAFFKLILAEQTGFVVCGWGLTFEHRFTGKILDFRTR
jgi:hypothetical protein